MTLLAFLSLVGVFIQAIGIVTEVVGTYAGFRVETRPALECGAVGAFTPIGKHRTDLVE